MTQLTGFFQHPTKMNTEVNKMTYIDKINTSPIRKMPGKWYRGGPLYEVVGSDLRIWRTGGTWDILSASNVAAGQERHYAYVSVKGVCFEDLSQADHQEWKLGYSPKKPQFTKYQYQKPSEVAGKRISRNFVTELPIVYDPNHASWRRWSSNGQMEYSM